MSRTTMQPLGIYSLDQQLASNEAGEVWRGTQPPPLGSQAAPTVVVVRILAQTYIAEPDRRNLFLHVARQAQTLEHCNIVRMSDINRDGESDFTVEEHINGLDLERLVRSLRADGRSLSQTQCGYIMAKLLRALAFAHGTSYQGQPIGHYGISASGVLISTRGEVKLGGFGISRVVMPDQSIGTPAQADLRGAGRLLQWLLDGQDQHTWGGDFEVFDALQRGLVEQRERRFSTARAALEYLDHWAGFRDMQRDLAALVLPLRGQSAVPLPSFSGFGGAVAGSHTSGRSSALESMVHRDHAPTLEPAASQDAAPTPEPSDERHEGSSPARVFPWLAILLGLMIPILLFSLSMIIEFQGDGSAQEATPKAESLPALELAAREPNPISAMPEPTPGPSPSPMKHAAKEPITVNVEVGADIDWSVAPVAGEGHVCKSNQDGKKQDGKKRDGKKRVYECQLDWGVHEVSIVEKGERRFPHDYEVKIDGSWCNIEISKASKPPELRCGQ
ncbi:protein kinase domain-containing protein [Nannocystaceae bacterium ST9]